MRQVRTCDFCGDDAAGLYQPYPPSVPDGPRLLLCDGCRERLSAVVDPLVAALEGGSEREAGVRGTPEPREAANEAPAAGAEEAPTEPARTADSGARTADSGLDADERASNPAETNSAGAEPGPVGESRDASGRSKRERGGTPPGYRKVMRLLENRELPMDRSDAEHLAAEAYELDEETVADAIDHAVEYGRLREVRGELKR